MSRHQISRVRHDIKHRKLTVDSAQALTPNMRRITLRSSDLHDFISASADDHIKLFFGPDPQEGERRIMRDYTPRSFDTEAGVLVIDFAMHDAGPATEWAAAAQPGDTLDIAGPRGSAVVPDDFDWYLLIGDETALPAIGRRIEELRAGVPVLSAVVIAQEEDRQIFGTRAQWTPVWAVRDGLRDDAALLIEALAGHPLPEGEGFIWIAGESSTARALRVYALETLRHPREWVKAAGYWRKGVSDAHERIED